LRAAFPWLDAAIETDQHLIGVESKRFEPYRDEKRVSFSKAYVRKVWGNHMAPYEGMRDALADGDESFQYLDAAQLVKHAFGLVTEGNRKTKSPVLVYLFAEPKSLNGKRLPAQAFSDHRAEIARFAKSVSGATVAFHALSYRDWLKTWPSDGPVAKHGAELAKRFEP
jgi:hypothetical protein